MTVDVIVAVSGELPANLAHTLDSVRATAPAAGIIVVVDRAQDFRGVDLRGVRVVDKPADRPAGCGQARHYGIQRSEADVVILVNGHMEFPEEWTENVGGYLRRHKRHVTCTINRSVMPKWAPYPEVDSGAHLYMHTQEPASGPYCPPREYHGLSAKWRAGCAPGYVSAPMGACYGMLREWYWGMGGPLDLLHEWGGDEELLGVCGWLCGGRTYCLPVETRHMYAAPRINRTHDPRGIWANRAAIVAAIPGVPAETVGYMRQTRMDWRHIDGLLDGRASRIAGLRAHLERQRRTFAGMVKAGLVTVNPATIDASVPASAPLPIAPPRAGACPRCDRGGMVPHRSVDGMWLRCLACGHRRSAA